MKNVFVIFILAFVLNPLYSHGHKHKQNHKEKNNSACTANKKENTNIQNKSSESNSTIRNPYYRNRPRQCNKCNQQKPWYIPKVFTIPIY